MNVIYAWTEIEKRIRTYWHIFLCLHLIGLDWCSILGRQTILWTPAHLIYAYKKLHDGDGKTRQRHDKDIQKLEKYNCLEINEAVRGSILLMGVLHVHKKHKKQTLRLELLNFLSESIKPWKSFALTLIWFRAIAIRFPVWWCRYMDRRWTFSARGTNRIFNIILARIL